MLGLRLDEPLALNGLEQALDASELARLEGHGLALRADRTLTLTRRGRFLGDGVTARLARVVPALPLVVEMEGQLSQRQQDLLRRVVEGVRVDGGSRSARRRSSRAGRSRSRRPTVRNDLAELERQGLMMHPHTSAGRVPTESGYRRYVDELLTRPEAHPDAIGLGLPAARAEVEEALQATTEAAVPGDAAARARLGAAVRVGDGPARRGAGCCSRRS